MSFLGWFRVWCVCRSLPDLCDHAEGRGAYSLVTCWRAVCADTLLETMRRTALEGTKLARAQCHTLRLRLLRIGAVVTRNTRTIAVRLSSARPDQAVFRLLVQRLTAG